MEYKRIKYKNVRGVEKSRYMASNEHCKSATYFMFLNSGIYL
ncbi:hypothetical protein CLOSBL3_10772 [Clostridiaceae bacterium BL-3]|nr:hypothetical protein CLOSBL3_10772 [Clostridiaceae bacterium BL-3]